MARRRKNPNQLDLLSRETDPEARGHEQDAREDRKFEKAKMDAARTPARKSAAKPKPKAAAAKPRKARPAKAGAKKPREAVAKPPKTPKAKRRLPDLPEERTYTTKKGRRYELRRYSVWR